MPFFERDQLAVLLYMVGKTVEDLPVAAPTLTGTSFTSPREAREALYRLKGLASS